MPRKVLLVTLAYYPSNAPASHRPVKTAKYLPDFGWGPTVLCADWTGKHHPARFDESLAGRKDVCPTVRVPYPPPALGALGRARLRTAESLFPYGAPRPVARAFLSEATRIAHEGGIDLIWSTYLPGFTHLVARIVSERMGIPWVADFRDLPDQEGDSWRSRRSVRYERQVCRRASAIVATSDALARRLAARHSSPVYTVLNGFDPDDYGTSEGPSRDRFTIAHYGTIYEHRDPRSLFRALDLLSDRGEVDLDKVSVEFHGPPQSQIRKLAEGFRCASVVRAPGRLPYETMLRRQQDSSLLLLLTAPEAGGAIPSKLFEYLGARRPILNVPGDLGEVDRILSETGCGVSAREPGGIAALLGSWYREWADSGVTELRGDMDRVQRFSRREQTRTLSGVFDSVMAGGGAGAGRKQESRPAARDDSGAGREADGG